MSSFESNVVANYQTVEYNKFVQITNNTQFPAVSVTRFNSPNVAGLQPVSSVDVYPKYAVLVKNVDSTSANYSGNMNMTSDAFGRTRMSAPLTLFDSSHRFADNNLWSTLTGGTTTTSASAQFNQNQGLVELKVNALSGSKVYRETTKVFAYQPGKSLQIMSTFTFNQAKSGLRQRVGYYGAENGIYLELDDNTLYMVERSITTGTLSSNRIPQSQWNVDRLDGSGPSGITLDITKAQILFMDIEWLGLGTVRTGFVINGQFVPCHYFHHANLIDSTYITTASLPLRYEIENKAATSGPSRLKQVCSTIISEGGYELRGLQQAVSIPIDAPIIFADVNTYYPIISIKLRTDRLDAIVILTALSILGAGDGKVYNWQVRASGTTTGGQWLSAGPDSSVQYNRTGASFTGGRILASGYVSSNNQSSASVDILKEALFKFQLERNYFTSTPYELTLVAAANSSSGTTGLYASMDWEEISR
jgi:hypothetical protein